MPIRPEFRQYYTAASGWPAVRLRILERAKDRCEQCGVRNGRQVERYRGIWRYLDAPCGTPWRNENGNVTTFAPIVSVTRLVRIALTVAHLNHDPGDNRDENLKALCQWCHLNYDKLHHKETRCRRKDATRPLLEGVAS